MSTQAEIVEFNDGQVNSGGISKIDHVILLCMHAGLIYQQANKKFLMQIGMVPADTKKPEEESILYRYDLQKAYDMDW